MDLIKALHENELFQAAINDLSEEERKTITSAAESVVRELSEVIEAASKRPEVLTPEVSEENAE